MRLSAHSSFCSCHRTRQHLISSCTRVRGSSSSSSSSTNHSGTNSTSGGVPALVFPHAETFNLDNRDVSSRQVIDLLSPSVSAGRLQKMAQVIASRCYGVVPVVEGLYDMGNLAAVCRSADALGFGAVHCIMSHQDKYKRSQRAAAGGDKWLDTRLWSTTSDCLSSLKQAGYQVVVTHLTDSSVRIQEVDWTRPTAFVLGNEQAGVSATAVGLADATAIIPMAGFVESFNISVAAALILYEAAQQRMRASGSTGDLSAEQQQQLLASFLLRGVKHSRIMVSELLNRPPPLHQKRYFRNQQGEAGKRKGHESEEKQEKQLQQLQPQHVAAHDEGGAAQAA